MDLFALSLKLNAVGEAEAIKALGNIDAAGKKVASNAVQWSGAVRDANQKTFTGMQGTSQAFNFELQKGAAAVAATNRAAVASVDVLGRRYGNAAVAVAGGLETIARTGQASGQALRGIIAQGASVAFMFGAAGPIVGAVGIAGLAIFEFATRTSRELKKVAGEIEKSFQLLKLRGDVGPTYERINTLQEERNLLLTEAARIEAANEAKHAGRTTLQRDLLSFQLQSTDSQRERVRAIDAELARLNTLIPAQAKAASDRTLEEAAVDRRAIERERSREAASRASLAHAERMKKIMDDLAIRPHAVSIGDSDRYSQSMTSQMDEALAQSVALVKGVGAAPQLTAPFERIGSDLGRTLANGFAVGIASALTGGDPLGALRDAVLGGFGSILSTMGQNLIETGLAMTAVQLAIKNPFTSGPAMIAAGVLLSGLGMALAGSMGGGKRGGSGGGGAGSYFGGMPAASTGSAATRVNVSPDSRVSGASIEPRNVVAQSFTIIGANDPKAQREIMQLTANAARRGL